MLEKIIKIKNIGRFYDYNAKGDVSLRKITLVFADNGRGKTTFCGILRSLQSGKSEYILERKTLGSRDEAIVQLRIDGSTTSFNNTSWSSTFPEIDIFDTEFIHNNVYYGDIVEHEQKKNLYRLIIGAEGKQLADVINDLDIKIRDANNVISDKRDAVSRTLPREVSIEEYVSWQPEEDIDSKINEKKNEITKLQHALDKEIEIKTKKRLCSVILPTIPSNFEEALRKQLTDISSEAESLVRSQVLEHNMGSQGETWLSQGLDFVNNVKCPFCGQVISGNNLLASYRSYFDASYKQMKSEIASLPQTITDAIGETSLNTALQEIQNNLALLEFWKQFIDISLPLFDLEDIRKKYNRLRESAYALVQRKQLSPIEPIVPDCEYNDSLVNVTNIKLLLETYNQAVNDINIQIDALKSTSKDNTVIMAF